MTTEVKEVIWALKGTLLRIRRGFKALVLLKHRR